MISSRLGLVFLHTTQGQRQRTVLKYMNFFHVMKQKHCIISIHRSAHGTPSNPHRQPSWTEWAAVGWDWLGVWQPSQSDSLRHARITTREIPARHSEKYFRSEGVQTLEQWCSVAQRGWEISVLGDIPTPTRRVLEQTDKTSKLIEVWGWPCFEQGARPTDFQRSLPPPLILHFCSISQFHGKVKGGGGGKQFIFKTLCSFKAEWFKRSDY